MTHSKVYWLMLTVIIILIRFQHSIRLDDEVITIVIYDKKLWPQQITHIMPDKQRPGVLLLAHDRGIDQLDITDPLHSRKSIIGRHTNPPGYSIDKSGNDIQMWSLDGLEQFENGDILFSDGRSGFVSRVDYKTRRSSHYFGYGANSDTCISSLAKDGPDSQLLSQPKMCQPEWNKCRAEGKIGFVAGYPKGLELYRGVRLYIQSTANTIIVYDNNRQCVVSRYINTRGRINFFYPRRHSPVVVIKSDERLTDLCNQCLGGVRFECNCIKVHQQNAANSTLDVTSVLAMEDSLTKNKIYTLFRDSAYIMNLYNNIDHFGANYTVLYHSFSAINPKTHPDTQVIDGRPEGGEVSNITHVTDITRIGHDLIISGGSQSYSYLLISPLYYGPDDVEPAEIEKEIVTPPPPAAVAKYLIAIIALSIMLFLCLPPPLMFCLLKKKKTRVDDRRVTLQKAPNNHTDQDTESDISTEKDVNFLSIYYAKLWGKNPKSSQQNAKTFGSKLKNKSAPTKAVSAKSKRNSRTVEKAKSLKSNKLKPEKNLNKTSNKERNENTDNKSAKRKASDAKRKESNANGKTKSPTKEKKSVGDRIDKDTTKEQTVGSPQKARRSQTSAETKKKQKEKNKSEKKKRAS